VKVLTAGTSGFVGRRLCPVLAAAGHHVVAMTRTLSVTPGELVRATGLGKATVYRLYPIKEALVAAYLRRPAATISAAIGEEITAHEGDPGGALQARGW
jgi:nucleoside-diphosphate-sugar epimerase